MANELNPKFYPPLAAPTPTPGVAYSVGKAVGMAADKAGRAAADMSAVGSGLGHKSKAPGWQGSQMRKDLNNLVAGFNGTPLPAPAPAPAPAAVAPVAPLVVAPAVGAAAKQALPAANVPTAGTTDASDRTWNNIAANAATPMAATAPVHAPLPAGVSTITPQHTSFGNDTPATSGDYKGMTQNEINSGWAHKNLILDAKLALQNPNTSAADRTAYLGMIAEEARGRTHSQDVATQANAQKYGADKGVQVAGIHSGDARAATAAGIENTNTTASAHTYGVDSTAHTAAQQLQLAAADSLGKRQQAAAYDAEYRAALAKGGDALQKFYAMHAGKTGVVLPIGAQYVDSQTGASLLPTLNAPGK